MMKVKGTACVSLRNAVRDERHTVFRHCGTSADNKTGRSKVVNDIAQFKEVADVIVSNRITEEINKVFGPDVAKALDHTSVSVRAPKDPSQKVSFMSLLENIEVDPASPIAKVVVNARTGTIVIGGDVRVTPAAVSHGSLTVKVNEDTNTTPGQTLYDDAGNVTTTTAANTENDTDIEAGADTASAFVFDAGTSLADVVDAINAIGTTSADLVAILEALRAAGALRAQMIII